MKKRFFIALFFFFVTQLAYAQTTLPAIDLTKLDGSILKASDLKNGDNPIIISFWATWCKPCMEELNTIADEYEAWQKETGVKLIAISTDDSRSASRVPTVMKSKGWKYDVYIDANQDLMRALQVVNIPHTFILNGKGEIVWQHTSYKSGDEEEYLEVLKEIKAGKK